MVKLTRIYTKTGDDGTTGLGDGSRRSKTDVRVEAYGQVDEANAALGLAVLEIPDTGGAADAGPIPVLAEIRTLLVTAQNDLFDVGADLCCPIEPGEKPGGRLRVVASQTLRLERAIDRYNDNLPALTSFVLPGGTRLAAALHLARTVVRRAERSTVALVSSELTSTNPETVRYLNRLSDLLFVLSRVANLPANGGTGDVLWVPGAGRGG